MVKRFLISIKAKLMPDRKFRKPRLWSNKELLNISGIFNGDVINVSGGEDVDKAGRKYKDYFSNARSYSISNYASEFRGFQGKEGEILLDLEKDLPADLIARWDVVLNHTTLEHIFDIDKAFQNLCLMSNDVVIVVVPWLQELHYGNGFKDYWRISPFALEKLFTKNALKLVHLRANDTRGTSVYILAVGSKNPDKWKETKEFSVNSDIFSSLGSKII